MRRIAIARLHFLLRLDEATGFLCWRGASLGHHADDRAGSLKSDGYRRVYIDGSRIYEHRITFAMTNGRWPDLHVDHANGVRDDNRPCNLREATRSQNNANSKISLRNTSGLKGVGFHKQIGRFRADIRIEGSLKYLGLFDSAEEAHAAYMRAAQQFHGQFARAA